MVGSPSFLFGCCAVDVGDAEGWIWSGAIAGEREQVSRVGHKPVLSRGAFVDEESAVFGVVWACEDCGDGVAHGWCPGEAERDIASVNDCV